MTQIKMTMEEYIDYVEAMKTLKEQLEEVKHSLYGLAGFGLPEGPLKQLKQEITNCISQAWRLKEGGEK